MTIAALLLLGTFFFFLLIRMEILMSVLLSSVITATFMGIPLNLLVNRTVTTLQSYNLLAVPLFIVAGEILSDGSLSEKIIEFVEACVGWVRGGLAMVNVMASTFFGGISGSPLADISSLGTVLIPMMKKQGYDEEFATDVTVTSAQQGLLIPPSHNMLIYAMAAGGTVSIGSLFMAGIIPGLLLAAVLMAFSYYLSVKRHYPKGSPFNLKMLLKTSLTSFWGLMTLVIIVVGCTTGVFTATEAAAISILWAIFVTTVIYRDMTWKRFWTILERSLKTVGIIMLSMGFSACFGFMVSYLRIPNQMSSIIYGFTDSGILIMLIVNLLLIFMGMIMDMASVLIIATPIFLPIAQSAGISPVHFGIIMIFNLAIGMMTPPVGGALMMGSIVSGIKMERLIVSLVPWLIIMFVTLLVITFFPDICMLLPNLLKS